MVFEGIDEFLCEVGGIAESGHIGSFANHDRIGFVVAGSRGIGLQATDLGHIAGKVMESLSALYKAAMSACHFTDLRIVFDFSHTCLD